MPWVSVSDGNLDVKHKIINEDCDGSSSVIIARIIERLETVQGKIICLSGLSGSTSYSIAGSVAHVLKCKFYEFSFEGSLNVARIKGRRPVDICAMPDKMVQCLKKVGTFDPLVLISHIDKLGCGLAESALLELFDPEQNSNVEDHFLGFPIDLSKVVFICTANVVENISKPLMDRMEVVSVGADEIMHIGRDDREEVEPTRENKPEKIKVTDALHMELMRNEYGTESEDRHVFLAAIIDNHCIREIGIQKLQKQIESVKSKISLWRMALQMLRESNQLLVEQDEDSPATQIDSLECFMQKNAAEEEQNMIQVK